MLWRPRRPGGGCCCCCSEAQRLLPHTPGLPCPTRLLPHTPGPPVPPLPGTQASLCPPHPWPPNPPLPSPSRHAGIAVAKVDSLGRRPLLLWGVSGVVVALLALGTAAQAGGAGGALLALAPEAVAWTNLLALLLYVGCYQVRRCHGGGGGGGHGRGGGRGGKRGWGAWGLPDTACCQLGTVPVLLPLTLHNQTHFEVGTHLACLLCALPPHLFFLHARAAVLWAHQLAARGGGVPPEGPRPGHRAGHHHQLPLQLPRLPRPAIRQGGLGPRRSVVCSAGGGERAGGRQVHCLLAWGGVGGAGARQVRCLLSEIGRAHV